MRYRWLPCGYKWLATDGYMWLQVVTLGGGYWRCLHEVVTRGGYKRWLGVWGWGSSQANDPSRRVRRPRARLACVEARTLFVTLAPSM